MQPIRCPRPQFGSRRVYQVRTVGAAGSGIGGIGSGRDVERQPAASVMMPLACQLRERALQDRVRAGEERNVIDECGDQAVADVPVGVAVVGLPPVRIHRRAAAVGIRGDVQRVRPGVADHGTAGRCSCAGGK